MLKQKLADRFESEGLREILTLTPLLVFVFWIGLHPEPFTRVLRTSVTTLLEQSQKPAALAQTP